MKKRGPVMLEDYVRAKRRRGRLFRLLCAGGLLFAAILLRCIFPDSAGTVRAWIIGKGAVNTAVEAFYACAEKGEPLPKAVEALCLALDGTEN